MTKSSPAQIEARKLMGRYDSLCDYAERLWLAESFSKPIDGGAAK